MKIPIVKVKGQAEPAIVLTFSVWCSIRRGIENDYLRQCARVGSERARLCGRKPEGGEKWCARLTQGAVDFTMRLYALGWKTHNALNVRTKFKHRTPEWLARLGERVRDRAFATAIKREQRQAVAA